MRVDFFIKALIESAINSYRIDNPTQSFFCSEIDILYPPNHKEFMDFIGYVNEKNIQLLSNIADHLRPQIKFHDGLKGAFDAIKEALNPQGYNMIVTPKEIDDLIENMKDVVARGINYAL
mgnify:CR=1 FL=1